MEPPFRHPYFIVLCLDKSSADSIGDSIRSTVKKAAKLAVYDEIIINVKNHHMPATMRVDTALKNIYFMYIVFDKTTVSKYWNFMIGTTFSIEHEFEISIFPRDAKKGRRK